MIARHTSTLLALLVWPHGFSAFRQQAQVLIADNNVSNVAITDIGNAVALNTRDEDFQGLEKQREGQVHEAQYVVSMGGPSRILREGRDQFDESVRAMEIFDKKITPDCSMKYGKSMLEAFRNTKHVVCDGLKSTVVCHQRQPFDIPRYMCELHHIQVSGHSTRAERCTPQLLEFGAAEGRFLKDLQSQDAPLKCSSTIDSNALLQLPWDMNNLYEWYGDWVTLWESLAALEWNPRDTEIFLVDVSSEAMKRPFTETWSRAFGDRLHMGTSEELFGEGLCFANAVIVPHGGLSTTTFNGGRGGSVECSSPTVMASALYLESLFITPAIDRDLAKKQVTLLLRSGARAFADDEAAQESVKNAIPSDWNFQTWRPERMSMADQLAVAAKTNVLVGVHGAGLSYVLFLPPNARVVEFFCDGRDSSNRHYSNMEIMSDEHASRSEANYHVEQDQHSISGDGCHVDPAVVSDAVAKYELI